MEAIIPYLNFNGDASDALDFYCKALDGEIVFKQTFGESPVKSSESQKNKIMHASFKSGDLNFLVSDGIEGQTVSKGTNLSLSLNFENVNELNKAFANLADGGKVTMELQDTFWGARFGMLTDKFGFNWMFNHDYKK
ncbi:MAG TPA: glyoxalase/bleomycin resistance/extradiol dioxygenase family protein [Hanamia sp.]|nr:glyoxalase/bleomycin resistance/extradiol dioxygenase family protein [Hanamia sp.]